MNCSVSENKCKLKSHETASMSNSHTTSRNPNPIRSDLAQWLATIANSTICLGVGLMTAISTVVNGALRGPDSELLLNDNESSWFAALPLLLQPIGGLIAAFLQNYIGRKSGMILMNVPELIAWIVLYAATSANALYVSAILMGLSIGFMEAPGLAYIGEISQPKIRGTLTSFSNINVIVGILVEFFLGSVLNWRMAVAVSAVFPIISIVLIFLIPDSPVWLLSKGRKKEALQALYWLRGWVPEAEVRDEFDELCRYIDASKFHSMKENPSNIHNQDLAELRDDKLDIDEVIEKSASLKTKLLDFFRPSMLKPFGLLLGYQIFYHSAALTGLKSFMVETFSTLNMDIKPQWIPFTSGAVMLLGGITCILTVNKVGKRRLSLVSMMACSVACVILGIYSLYENYLDISWIPTVLFCILYYSSMIGISPIPWMLMSEVYPIRGRSIGAGLSAASYYFTGFLFTKTYLNLQSVISLHGCFFLYGAGGIIGFIFLYNYLPETEGKSLAEVEQYFTGSTKRSVLKNPKNGR